MVGRESVASDYSWGGRNQFSELVGVGGEANFISIKDIWRRMSYLILLMLLVMYQVGRVTMGLAVHPYRTMREVVRKKWLWPMGGMPVLLLVGLLISGRVGAWFWEVPIELRNKLAGMLTIAMVGLLLWQGELGYLWWRFIKSTQKQGVD